MERKKAIEIVKKIYNEYLFLKKDKEAMVTLIPELKENEDERIRKTLIEFFSMGAKYNCSTAGISDKDILAWLEKQGQTFTKKDVDDAYLKGVCDAKQELEKQVTPQTRTGDEWVNMIDDACDKRYSEEYANGEYCHEQSFKWGFQEGVEWLEKQGEQKHQYISRPRYIGEEELLGEQKPSDKVEPKFKVKYAGSEYNVLEVKDIGGVIFYGIEDEPNHIDYVKAENCEIISGYAIKEKGSPYPTNPAEWSEEDNLYYDDICEILVNLLYSKSSNVNKSAIQKDLDWFITFVKQTKNNTKF